MVQKEDKKRKGWTKFMEDKGTSHQLDKEALQDEWWKRRRLKCSHTQDKTHYENSQVSQKHSCKVCLLSKIQYMKYMRQNTLFIGQSVLENKIEG